MKKLLLTKTSEISHIVDFVSQNEEDSFVVEVPRFSKLASSAANFRILKKELNSLGKEVIFETVDPKIIELAKVYDFQAINPFFDQEASKKFSDIIHPGKKSNLKRQADLDQDFKLKEVKSDKLEFSGEKDSKDNTNSEAEDLLSDESLKASLVNSEQSKIAPLLSFGKKISDKISYSPRFSFSTRTKIIFAVSILVILPLSLYAGLVVLPRANITIKLARKNWSFNDAVLADANLSKIDYASNKIPAQIFKDNRNLALSFPTNSKKKIEDKASGAITIYNGFSSTPQALIQGTRFQSSDGKIFRLAKKIIVPGAKIVDGKIETSEINAEIIADKPGEEYNISTSSSLELPGFKGNAKYGLIYGLIKTPLTHGFIGEIASPTFQEIKSAKDEAYKNLESSMKSLLIAKAPRELKYIDGSISFRMKNQEVQTDPKDASRFSIFSEGEISTIGFNEKDLLSLVSEKIKDGEGADMDIKNFTVNYNLNPKANLTANQISFKVDYKATLAKQLSASDLKSKLSNKSETEVKALIFSVSGLESAEVSFWPFWIKKVPEQSKINLVVD